MPRLKLTTRAIDRLRAPTPDGKQQLHWDTELRGFGVLLSGTSNSKSFVVQRDILGERAAAVSRLGRPMCSAWRRHGPRAEGILAVFYQGTDPKTPKPVQITLRAALEDYLQNVKLRPNSIRDYRKSVENHLTAWLNRPLHSIDAAQVIERHREIASSIKADGRSSGAASANGVMRVLRALWNYAASSDTHPAPNPTGALRSRVA